VSTIYVIAQVDFDLPPGSGVCFIFIYQQVNPIEQVRTPMDIANGIDREAIWCSGVFMPNWVEHDLSLVVCLL
jgi:hypothetical protein